MLFSCVGKKKPAELDLETLITQQSDTLTMIMTKNGKKDYRFSTPLMERYELAREPYMEFRYGINIITFDSLGNESSDLVADYAIYYENRELWEARGNVRGTGEDGRKLYTQQLFWDEKTDMVYSNVDCKVVDGNDEFVGEGFESDSEFKDWVFRESEGRMWVDMSESDEEAANDNQASADKATSEDGNDGRGDGRGGADEQEPKMSATKGDNVKQEPSDKPSNTNIVMSEEGERNKPKLLPRRDREAPPKRGDVRNLNQDKGGERKFRPSENVGDAPNFQRSGADAAPNFQRNDAGAAPSKFSVPERGGAQPSRERGTLQREIGEPRQ